MTAKPKLPKARKAQIKSQEASDTGPYALKLHWFFWEEAPKSSETGDGA